MKPPHKTDIAAVPTYFIAFYLVPALDGFTMFVLAIFPFLFIGVGIATSLRRAGEAGAAIILFGNGLAPENIMQYDVVAFFNGVLARVISTLIITAVGISAGVQLWQRYMLTPWTRDGRVVANSVTIASEVSGRIVDICVRENQSVKKGEILFIIDQSTYKAALDSAEASVASLRATMMLQQSNAARAHKLTSLSISAQQLEDLDLQAKSAEANYQQALAVRENAKINLDRITVYAPVNGYVTNLVVDEGDFAEAGKAVLAVVDSDSFRVEAYLEETKLNFVQVGDSATVILMSGAPAIKGQVESIARGIGDTENPVGQNLLQNVNATFEWVRLAQRIPVRIKLVEVPNGTILSSGMTATVRIEPKHQSEKEDHLVFSESRAGRP
jgi:multidrug resistance efflux pump